LYGLFCFCALFDLVVITQTSIPVYYKVNNGTPTNATWTGSLAPGNSTIYTFPATFNSPGKYEVCANTQLFSDTYTFNDGICKVLSKDAADTYFVEPAGNTKIGDSITVKVRMENLGSDPITAMDVAYQVSVSPAVVESWTGNLLPGAFVNYTFKKIGKFNVHLRFVDQNNLVENYYREIEITTSETPLLSADIEASPALSGSVPLQIRFDAGKSASLKGKITDYEWDFGDGSQLTKGKSVSHIYSKVGTYTVTLTIKEDSGNTDSATETVEVKGVSGKPVAAISATPAPDKGVVSGDLPLKVSLDGSKSTDADNDIVSYDWDINGVKKVGQTADYTFDKAGTYSITLKVTDSDNQVSSASVSVTVTEPGVKAVITASPEEGVVPLTVSFDGSSSSTFKGNIVSYEWDFGDKSAKSITGARITHKYDKVGTYEVALKVTTNSNESSTVKKNIYVREIPLRACFSPSRSKGTVPLTVTFDSQCSTGAVSTYKWDFADGNTSTSRKPSHTFDISGTYNVTLEVADDKNNVGNFSDVIVVSMFV